MTCNKISPAIAAVAIALASLVGSTIVAAQQPIALKLGSPAPPRSYLHSDVFQPWIDDVNKSSGGTLKIEAFYGGQLGNFGVIYDRVVDGVADIGFIVASFAAGKFRMHEVAALPFESGPSVQSSTALWRMYEKGVTRAEFNDTVPIAIWVFANAALHSREPIRVVEDMKGKRISAGNSATGKIIATLGAAPSPFRPDELYQVLQRGTIDGSLINYSAVGTFKLAEVVKHHVDLPLGGDPAMLIMNRKKYESLPPAAKAAIDKHSFLSLSQKTARRADEDWAQSRDAVKDRITPMSREEQERWRKALAPVAASWAKEAPNGEKVLAAFREEVKAFGPGK
ncbi:MAG: TRAP transporter substrate-binding protein [Betaproteobacteria bacterium]|nr:TRAP transporter substrate-binding protein [Betaproteobacteria bacterium]